MLHKENELIIREVYIWANISTDNTIRYYRLPNGNFYYNSKEEAIAEYEFVKNDIGWDTPISLILLTEYRAF